MDRETAEEYVGMLRDDILLMAEMYAEDFLNFEDPSERLYEIFNSYVTDSMYEFWRQFEKRFPELSIDAVSIEPIEDATEETMLMNYLFRLRIKWHVREGRGTV